MDITKKIKSYEDACKALNLDPANLPVVDNLPEKDRKYIVAYYKLTVIIRALNEGWEPNWQDWDEYKYFNWFYIDFAGFACAAARGAVAGACAGIGSRLCFKNATLARYARETFESLYLDYLFIEIPQTYNNNSKK